MDITNVTANNRYLSLSVSVSSTKEALELLSKIRELVEGQASVARDEKLIGLANLITTFVKARHPTEAALCSLLENKRMYNVLSFATNDRKINAIKELRDFAGFSLKASKDIVEGPVDDFIHGLPMRLIAGKQP